MSHQRDRIPLAVALAVVCTLSLTCAARAQEPGFSPNEQVRTPLLAYYYIRFDPRAWEKAKADSPLLGRYSSDDQEAMRYHVEWAKMVGIDGFIVSWKSTEKLDRRLDQLVEVSAAAGIRLAIIYQGLDFEQNPRLTARVAGDLTRFADRYADNEVFDIFGRPLVIWNGTWEYSRDDVAEVTRRLGDRLLVLSAARNVEDYLRLADLVDGNSYYWSSVDPETHPGYPERLVEMGQAVHAQGGLWVAPAAPGYDSRPIGGTRVVERKDGETLRRQIAAAMQSSPDAIGLISWNEFSENTYVEPSEKYGVRYLQELADLRAGVAPSSASPELLVRPIDFEIHTIPPLPGMRFHLDGRPFASDEHGIARIQVEQAGTYRLEVLPTDTDEQDHHVEFRRWQGKAFARQRDMDIPSGGPIAAGFEVSYPVSLTFVDQMGRPVSANRITSVTVRSSDGFRHTFEADQPKWLRANRVVERRTGLEAIDIGYSVETVVVDEVNAVNRAQRFYPALGQECEIELLLHSARFAARDALFRFPIGSGISLEHPNGSTEFLRFESDAQVTVDMLVRGLYRARVEGAPGIALSTPVALSRDQELTLWVISYLDMTVVLFLGASLALGLLFIGRPRLLDALRGRILRSPGVFLIVLLVTGIIGYGIVGT